MKRKQLYMAMKALNSGVSLVYYENTMESVYFMFMSAVRAHRKELAAGRTTFEMNKLQQSTATSETYASCSYLKPNQLEIPAFASAVFFPTVLSKVSAVS